MIRYQIESKYEEIIETVEQKIWTVVTNDMVLKDEVFNVCKSIFINGNTGDTERELRGVLENDESKVIRGLKENIGDYMIRHIIDKNYMDELVEIFEDKIIEEIVEDIKDGIVELSLEEVLESDVIEQGHFDNLIDEEIQDEGEIKVKTRTWHSRMGVDDGMPYDNQISVEIWVNENLQETVKYEAL